MLRTAFALLLLAAPPSDGPAGGVLLERRALAMGTELGLAVEAESRAEALAASEAALRRVAALEARLSTWRDDSELARLNAAAVGAPVAPSPDLARALAPALRWRAETAGAFTPTVGPLVAAWACARAAAGRRGTSSRALGAAGEDAWRFELPTRVTRLAPDAALEEGGFVKGYALDEAADELRARGARGWLDLGGQLLAVDVATPREVRLAHPDRRDEAVVALTLARGSCATSGNSERGLRVDGERLGHVLDPRDGQPARDFGALTVVAATAVDADCLSTALYVLGPDAALAFVHARPELEVVLLERAGASLRVRASRGLRGRLTPLSPALAVEWYDPPASAPPPLPQR
ncbi:MAG: FAD:protein FMN transferase [Planctomycetes bacterium]|nr:FAD:protein FMN transferase [Planctomycetota bacterium]